MFRYNVSRRNNEFTLAIKLTSNYDGLQKLSLVHTGWRVVEGSSPRTVAPTFLDGTTILAMDLVRGQEVAIEVTLTPERLPSTNFELAYHAGGSLRQQSYVNLLQYENDEYEDDEGAVF